MLPERLAHDVEAAREGCVAEASLAFPWPAAPDGCRQRLFRVDELGLRLGQGRGERRHRLTRPVHELPPSLGRRSSPPPLSTAWPAPRARSPPWRPPASGP